MLKNIILPVLIFSWGLAILSGYDLLKKRTGDWKESQATVVETSTPKYLSGGEFRSVSYGTCISYSYRVEGNDQEGIECGILNTFDTREEAVLALQNYLEENRDILVVRYSIADPSESYLVVDQKEKRTAFGFIISLSIALASSIFAPRILRKRKSDPIATGQRR